jgi:hypothetical protein
MIALVTAALLLLHSLAGCCWHHAHHAAGHDDLATVSACGHRCPDHAADAENHPLSDEDSDHEECDGARCVFVGSAGWSTSIDHFSASAAVVPALCQPSLDAWPSPHLLWSGDWGPPHRSTPGGPLVLRI